MQPSEPVLMDLTAVLFNTYSQEEPPSVDFKTPVSVRPYIAPFPATSRASTFLELIEKVSALDQLSPESFEMKIPAFVPTRMEEFGWIARQFKDPEMPQQALIHVSPPSLDL
jgi:hypothetical protein